MLWRGASDVDDETFGQRTKRLRKEKKLNQEQLAQLSGVSQTTISDIERGRNEGSGFATPIAAALGTTAEHLLTGKAPKGHIPVGVTEAGESIMVPILSVRGGAGGGAVQPDQDTVIDHMQLTRRWVSTHCPGLSSTFNLSVISAKGDSMTPTFNDGDILLVDTGISDIKLDAVYVFSRSGELFVKRVQRLFDGSIMVRSDNPVYEPQTIKDPARAGLHINGRVLWAWNGRRL